MNRQRLDGVFPSAGITRNGIFGHMYNALQTRPAWLNDLNVALRLDRVFFGKYGRQIISPLLERYLIDGAITSEGGEMLAADVYALHSVQWEKKYALLSVQYNPISNYDMTETESISTETEDESSGSVTGGGYSETRNTASGTITEGTTESGTATRGKTITGTITDTLTKAGTETHETAYVGKKQNKLERIGAERTIESWEGNQQVTTAQQGTEADERNVYAFNSSDYEPANRTEHSFSGRQTIETTVNPQHTTETAQRDRNDTETETFDGRKDTLTDSFEQRTDTNAKNFNGYTETENENFNNRKSEKVFDDSGHTATERYDNNLSEDTTHSATGNSVTSRTLQRSGNIGVTTSQQMAQSEIALWQWNFYADVFADVRKDITTGAY